MSDITFRRASRVDLPAIVALLADDPLGHKREIDVLPLPQSYSDAFTAIDQDANNELVVVDAASSQTVIGVLQITFIPCITYQGGWRALVEGVRISSQYRASGVGRKLLLWAIQRARERECHLIQLTTDKERPDAIRFYEGLGFVASHEGMKLHLQ